MHAPIQGSQLNPPAKLFKRFTFKQEHEIDYDGKGLVVNSQDTITFENNRYVCHYSFAWVEATDLQESEIQPIRGLIVETANMTIKMNAPYIQRRGDVTKPETGDIVQIGSDFWVIQDGVQRTRHKTLRNLATVYLPLRQLI